MPMIDLLSNQVMCNIRSTSSSNDKNISKHIQLENWSVVKAICRRSPKQTFRWSTRTGFFNGTRKSRVLPIHEAFANRAPPDVIEALLEAYPASIALKESCFGLTPLHIACKFNAPVDSIRVAIKYNACASTRDNHGRTPIHYVCSRNCKIDALRLLVKTYSKAVYYVDHRGWLPIHNACRYGADYKSIKLLVSIFPESVRARTNMGFTPLKTILSVNCDEKEKTLQLLINDGMLTKYCINRDPEFALFMPNDKTASVYREHNSVTHTSCC